MAKKNSLKMVPFGTKYIQDPDTKKYVERDAMLEFTYGSEEHVASGVTYIANDPFVARLRLVSLERGRSAARFWFENTATGTLYPFFGQGMVNLLLNALVNNGVVEGTWKAVKRGANYGLELQVEENE